MEIDQAGSRVASQFYKKNGFKKKYYKKRGFTKIQRKFSSYDGIYYAKLCGTYSLVTNGSYGTFRLIWGNNTGSSSGVGGIQCFNDVTEWATWAGVFGLYRIIGLKMECYTIQQSSVYATNVLTGGAAVGVASLSQVQFASTPDFTPTSTISDADMQKQIDYKSYMPGTSIKRYVNLRKYYSGKAKDWLSINIGPEYYPVGGSVFKITTQGFASGTVVGTVRATWYVQLKGSKN